MHMDAKTEYERRLIKETSTQDLMDVLYFGAGDDIFMAIIAEMLERGADVHKYADKYRRWNWGDKAHTFYVNVCKAVDELKAN